MRNQTAYEQALLAMQKFLQDVGEQKWAKWLQEDLTAWRTFGDVSHHRSAYGGMGSFNDVVICRVNQHKVTVEQEPWANSFFEWLKAVLFYLSKFPTEIPTANSLRIAVGRYSPSLSAFVGGERAPDTMRGFSNTPVNVTGARCLTCGYAELTPDNIDSALADELVPELVFEACAQGSLVVLVDRVLRLDLPGLAERREQLRSAAMASGIHLSDREGWMRPCPQCGSDDTAVYRWLQITDPQPILVSASNNLPLRRATNARPLLHNQAQPRTVVRVIVSLIRKLLGRCLDR